METEEEQVERLKKWLKENGFSIVAGIVIGISGLVGYRYWQEHQLTTSELASDHFSQMIEALDKGESEDVQTHAQALIDEYSSTDYATLAQLALARDYLKNEEFEQAEQALKQVVGSAGQEPLAYLARTRLAAVQMQREQFEQALTTLQADFPQAFGARVDELRGDILSRKGDNDAAREAYERALLAEPGPANPQFLQQKLQDLGVSS